MLTIKKVPTVMSIHQLDTAEEVEANLKTVACVCKSPQGALPTINYSACEEPMKRVRSFGSFEDLRVPDIDDESSDSESNSNGFVQDVSQFDRALLAAWEDRFAAGLFRYDVTQVKTKVVPGKFNFVAQYNEGRATKKRPTEFSVDVVCQEFDGKKFNFTKAGKEEILFSFQQGGRKSTHALPQSRDAYGASAAVSPSANVVLINVSPIEYGHVLLVPRVTDCLPQQITPELLLPPLYMAAESRNPYFRVGYNSLGAYATINHLHFQAYYLMEAFPIERAPTKKFPQSVFPPSWRGRGGAPALASSLGGGGLKRHHKRHHDDGGDDVSVTRVTEFPVRCLCFELGQTFETLARVVGRCCERLQRKNVPFNLLIADHGARVFLIPQVFSHRVAKGEIPEDVVATGVNPAVFEISGHLLYKQEGDYDNVTEEDACRLLECASLSEEEFLETVTYMLADEAVSEDDSSSSPLTPPSSGVVTNATPLSPAAVAAAAAVAGKAQAAKVAAAAAVAVESHAFVDSDSDDAAAKSEDGVVPSNSP